MLSRGGFSIVYLAQDENGLPVAIKEYLPSQLALRNEGDALPSIKEEHAAAFQYGMRCFFEEGRSLALLSHTNLVRVLARQSGTQIGLVDLATVTRGAVKPKPAQAANSKAPAKASRRARQADRRSEDSEDGVACMAAFRKRTPRQQRSG